MNPTVARTIVDLIREAPDLLIEFKHVLLQMGKGRTPESVAAIKKFNTLAAKELSGKDNPHKIISQLRTHFNDHAERLRVAGGGAARKGAPLRAEPKIAVPDLNDSKKTLRLPIVESRLTHTKLGTRQTNVERKIVLGKGVAKGRTEKRRVDVPDDSEVVSIKVGGDTPDAPYANNWILARYDADNNVYKPVSPGRGPGQGHQVFTEFEHSQQAAVSRQDKKLRKAEGAAPDKSLDVDAAAGGGLAQAAEEAGKFKAPGMGRGPVQHLLAKEAHEAKLREPSHLESRHKAVNENHVKRAIIRWDDNQTGVNAPRRQTREMREDGHTRGINSPFPDPRGTRYDKALPEDRAPRAQTHEVEETHFEKGRGDAIIGGEYHAKTKEEPWNREGGEKAQLVRRVVTKEGKAPRDSKVVKGERIKEADAGAPKNEAPETTPFDGADEDDFAAIAYKNTRNRRGIFAGMSKQEIEHHLASSNQHYQKNAHPERKGIDSPFPRTRTQGNDREHGESELDRVLREVGLGHGPARFHSRSKFTTKTESLEQLLLRLKLGGGTPFTPKS